MRYLPHTQEDIASMLEVIGADNLEALAASVPEDCRRDAPLNLPEPMSEWELDHFMGTLSDKMASAQNYKVFAGAGSYEHFIPATVSALADRSEFVTSYTPYQPEMSQGTLQGIFEYQTLVARLLGMEVANASLYDGATALAEALLMAVRIAGRKKVALSRLIHPHYRKVVATYLGPTDINLIELPFNKDGSTDLSPIDTEDGLAAVAVQSPNFFGCLEALDTMDKNIHDKEALFIVCFSEPLAYGLYKNPGTQGADIVCGDGQSLGIPQSFGGPALGVFASQMAYVRNMPGRLVGETTDEAGRRGFVLTLATREQHIRREKATSNICTNNSHCALRAAIYMASLGGTGLRRLARLNYDKCEYLKREIEKQGLSLPFSDPTFNEFVVKLPAGFDSTYDRLKKNNIVAGLPLAPYYPELSDHYLFCVTETKSRQDMNSLVREMTS
jgi:glycine dehydrogenase subunit 1